MEHLKKHSIKLIIQLIFFQSFILSSQESKLLNDFFKSKEENKIAILPDFSYAGYSYGEKEIPNSNRKIFDVTKYGAIPNDNKEDYNAIQKAIDAAEKNNGGIVYFPKGRFLINEKKPKIGESPRPPLRVSKSNIIIRGSGSDEKGTVLFSKYNRTAFKKPNFLIKPLEIKLEKIGYVLKGNKKGSFSLKLTTTNKLKIGDYIEIQSQSPQLFNPEYLYPYEIDYSNGATDNWSLMRKGKFINEKHRIEKVNGNEIVFKTPLRFDIDDKFKWKIVRINLNSEFGFENLMMEGQSTPNFVHHKNPNSFIIDPNTGLRDYDFHDGGFSGVFISNYSHSWVNNVTMKSWSNAIQVANSSNITISDVTIKGNKGHNSIVAYKASNILMNRIKDLANTHHGPEISGHSTGCVIKNSQWSRWVPIDAHGGHPYCNLVDISKGGLGGTPGGNTLPHHGPDLVLWNFTEIDNEVRDINFWNKKRFIRPIIVGYKGMSNFSSKSVSYMESFKVHVKTKSLYEAQLNDRLNIVDAWWITDSPEVDIPIEDGDYFIESAIGNHQTMTSSWNGSYHNVVMRNFENSSNRKWNLKHLENHIYTLQNVATKKYLEYSSNYIEEKANISTSNKIKEEKLKWKIEQLGNKILIRPITNLDKAIYNGGTNINMNIVAHDYDKNDAAVKWNLTKVDNSFLPFLDNNIYYIQSLGIKGENYKHLASAFANNHAVFTEKPNEKSKNQKYQINHIRDNIYSIKNMWTKGYLRTSSSTCNAYKVDTNSEKFSNRNEKWIVDKLQNGYYTLKPFHCTNIALNEKGIVASYNKENSKQWWYFVRSDFNSLNRKVNFKKKKVLSTSKLKIFPNPGKQTITINGVKKNEFYIIYNLFGEVFLEGVTKGKSHVVDIKRFIPGVYVLKIKGKKAIQFVKK